MAFGTITKKYEDEKKYLIVNKVEKIEVIPSGSWVFDNLTGGIGGFARGRLSEVHGLESAGKSTIITSAAAQAQKKNMAVLYLDNEHAFEATYAAKLGLVITDPNLCRIYRPLTLEENMDIIEEYFEDAKRLKYSIFLIIDSMATMIPKDIYNDTLKTITNWGLTSKLQTALVQKLTKQVSETNSIGIMVSQMRANTATGPMAAFAPKEKSTGGYAYRHLLSARFLLRPGKKEKVKTDDKVEGNVERDNVLMVSVKNIKNKVGMPYLTGTMYIKLGEGIDNTRTALEAAISKKIVVRAGKGGMVTCDKIPAIKGRTVSAVSDLLSKDSVLLQSLLKELGWLNKDGKVDLSNELTQVFPSKLGEDGDDEDEDEEED